MAKRAEILDVALRVIDQNGYSNATIRELADAVGLSQNGLLHYFGSKDELFLEILRHRDAQLLAEIGDDVRVLSADYHRRVLAAAEDLQRAPGHLELLSRLSAEAAESDHPAHEYFATRFANSRRISAQVIAELQREDRVPSRVDPAMVGTIVQAVMDGVQTQWAYDRSIDMVAVLDYLLDALGVADTETARASVSDR